MRPASLRYWRVAVALVSGAVLATACTSPDAASGTDAKGAAPKYETGLVNVADSAGEPVEGGTLTIAGYTEARSLDPSKTIATGSSGGIALAAVYDTLVRFNVENGEYEPWLAKSLKSSDNHTKWTLRLRDGVTFSDGTPLDARAVLGSIKYYIDNHGYQSAILAGSLADMKAVDPNTVVFHMKEPWASFPNMLAQGPGMIVAPAAIDGAEFEPIGAGPFTLQRYAPQEELILQARDDYWRGSPPLAKVRFVWFGKSDLRMDALKSGTVDVAYFREPIAVDTAVETGHAGFMTVTSGGHVIWINNRDNHPGADPRVRKAVALAIDPELTYRRAFEDAGMPSKALFPEASQWHSAKVKPLPVDRAKAKKLLRQAKADGYDGKISFMSIGTPTARQETLAAKAMLEKVGFTVKLDFVRSVADQIKRLYVSHDYDLARGAMSIADSNVYGRLYSSLSSESTTNASGYRNPRMDKLLGKLQAAGSPEQKQRVITKIERLWNEGVPGVSMAPRPVFIAWQENVHGIVPTTATMLLLGDAWKAA